MNRGVWLWLRMGIATFTLTLWWVWLGLWGWDVVPVGVGISLRADDFVLVTSRTVACRSRDWVFPRTFGDRDVSRFRTASFGAVFGFDFPSVGYGGLFAGGVVAVLFDGVGVRDEAGGAEGGDYGGIG